MLGTGMTLDADHRDGRAAPWVKRIDDPDLNRRTPGSMTLLRIMPKIFMLRPAFWLRWDGSSLRHGAVTSSVHALLTASNRGSGSSPHEHAHTKIS